MFRILSTSIALGVMAAPVMAHGGHGADLSGLAHPFMGLDHVIAMVAVGIWAVAMGRGALLAVPGAFLAAMVGGFGLSLAGVTVPGVEPMILASVIALGVLVALAVRVNMGVAIGIAGIFGLFHGAAHGAELGDAGALSFAAGFVVATAALHLAGAGLGLVVAKSPVLARFLGAAAALGCVILTLG